MATIHILLSALDERELARRVAVPQDTARLNFPLRSNTVTDFNQFENIIANYYNYHHTKCVSNGGRLSPGEASGRAKELLEKEYRKKNGDIVSAYNDAQDGTNGGMRTVLDVICDGIKAEVVERHIRYLFDRHVAPNSWDQKVNIIRQFIAQAGPYLSSSIVTSQPERYAQNYVDLVRSYTEGLRQTSSMFRRF